MLPSLSESLKMMVDYKYIYEEDQEEYLKFCSIDNLRRELAKGRERIYLNYRTLIKQEYRWVCMEVIRSAEYKPDDQIAMMYIPVSYTHLDVYKRQEYFHAGIHAEN